MTAFSTTNLPTGFAAQVQAMHRANGEGTRSSYDYSVSDYVYGETIQDVLAAALAWQRESKARGYEVGWVMVDDPEDNFVGEVKAGDVEFALFYNLPLQPEFAR